VTLNNCDPSQEQCVFDLPRITNADYDTYRTNPLYRRVYTVLRWATYPGQRDVWVGSHKGVDIATIPETPVYAVQEWKVIQVWWQGNRWNVIVIEHDHEGGKIYSSYAHVWDVFVRAWDFVAKWHMIGEVWDTGNASWPHLHRQMDINQNGVYPFHFYNCPGSLAEIVNNGSCRNQLVANTLDPIGFIEEQIQKNPEPDISQGLSFHGFIGGYSQQDVLQLFHIRQINMRTRLSQPIRVRFNEQKVSVFPTNLSFIGSQRTLYIRWLQPGLTFISLMQWDTVVQQIPLIIWEEKTFHIANDEIMSLFSQLQ